MNTPRFAIINTVDAPIRKHVSEWKEGVGYCYMARAEDSHLKKFDGMSPSRPTAIEDFGFSVLVRNGNAVFTRTHDCVATYEDGAPRRWHGSEDQFTLPLVSGKMRRHSV